MTDAEAAPAPTLGQRLRAVAPIDWLMLVLALLSVGLLAWATWGPADEAQRKLIIATDVTLCGLFAIEFLWRWYRSGWGVAFVLRNWYEILGMIPVTHPALRAFRLLRLIRIAVLMARVGAAADRAFGEYFTYLLLSRFKAGIVEAIRGVVTLAVLEEVAEVLQKGHYTRNVASALEQNLDSLEDVVAEKLAEHPRLGRLSRLPFYGEIVRAATETTFQVVLHVLQDARTDALVADILRENIEQIRAAVKQRDEARNRMLVRRG